MKQLQTILLIDDNHHDNYFHEFVLQEANIASQIRSFQYAEDALAYLKTPESNNVELIFLDINMPRMNGFEFLEAYEKLGKSQVRVIITMLTTSLNPKDEALALSHKEVKAFLNKPLAVDTIIEVVEKYF